MYIIYICIYTHVYTFFTVLVMEPRTSYMLGKYSTLTYIQDPTVLRKCQTIQVASYSLTSDTPRVHFYHKLGTLITIQTFTCIYLCVCVHHSVTVACM